VPEFVSAEGKKLKDVVMPELKAAVVEAVSAAKPDAKSDDAKPEEKKEERSKRKPPPPCPHRA